MPVLDIYPRETKTCVHTKTCMSMFLAILGTIAKHWKSNQMSINKQTMVYSYNGTLLTIKGTAETQYFGHLMRRPDWKRPWCWERLKAEGEGIDRGWDGWMTSLIQWTWIWANSADCEGQRSLVCHSPWGYRVGHNWVTEQQQKRNTLSIHATSMNLKNIMESEISQIQKTSYYVILFIRDF